MHANVIFFLWLKNMLIIHVSENALYAISQSLLFRYYLRDNH